MQKYAQKVICRFLWGVNIGAHSILCLF